MNIVMEWAFRSDPRATTRISDSASGGPTPRRGRSGLVLFKLAKLVERHLVSRRQISGDIGNALVLVSFYKNRAVVGFRQLTRNLDLILGLPGSFVRSIREGEPRVGLTNQVCCAHPRESSQLDPRNRGLDLN